MDAVMGQMNVFLRAFSTINRLFCEVRWLERNLRNSNMTTMVIVGGILTFCLFSAITSSSKEDQLLPLPPGVASVLKNWGPMAIVALVVGLFMYRRRVWGAMEGHGNVGDVLFGSGPQHHDGEDDHRRLEEGRATAPVAAHAAYSASIPFAPSKPCVQPTAVEY